jgi:predicted GTPase
MEKSCFGPDGLLARMVRSMPNVAIDVLNKCEEKKEFEAGYDFFALQTVEGILVEHLCLTL